MKFLIAFTIVSFASSVICEEVQETKKANIAINALIPSGIDSNTAEVLTDAFRTKLVKSGGFNVMERSNMSEVLQEQEFQKSDQCDVSSCAVEMGRLLGVEKIIIGSIGKVGETWSVNVRMVDIQTGKIEKDETQNYKGSEDGLLTEVMPTLVEKLVGTYQPKSEGGSGWIWGGAAALGAAAVGAGTWYYLDKQGEDKKNAGTEQTGTVSISW